MGSANPQEKELDQRIKSMALPLPTLLALGCTSPLYFHPLKGLLATGGSVPVLKGT